MEKREKIFSCDEECPAGWQYEPSPLYPQQCCGQCVQVRLGCYVPRIFVLWPLCFGNGVCEICYSEKLYERVERFGHCVCLLRDIITCFALVSKLSLNLQVACVVEGEVKAVGESWESDDQCTTYTCYRDNKVS